MSQVLTEPRIGQTTFTLHFSPAVELSDEQFFALCRLNRGLRLERTAEGDIIVMAPTGWITGDRNAEIIRQLRNWAKADESGVGTDSSTGFQLPNGADRAPDAAWVLRSRVAKLTVAQKERFLPLCPDFVVELLSPSDDLADVQAKMAEYIENGSQLGWLIDPEARQVHVYRPRQAVVIVTDVLDLSADPELPGFVLDLREIWEPKV